MTIFITCREFYEKSSTLLERRPDFLKFIDQYLEDYHRVKTISYNDEVFYALTYLDRYIKLWTKNKKTCVVKGKKRYKNYRDRYGIISELEKQVKLTFMDYFKENPDFAKDVEGIGYLSESSSSTRFSIASALPPQSNRMGKRFNSHMTFSDNLSESSSSTRFSIASALPPQSNRMGKRFNSHMTFPDNLSESPSSTRSLTNSVETMSSVSQDLIEFDAYEAAAGLINMATPSHKPVSAKDVQKSVLKIASSLYLIDLYRGMEKLNTVIFYGKHCTASHMTAILNQASKRSPVLICVRGYSTKNRLIICYGLQYEGEGDNQCCSYLVKDARDSASNETLELNGDYFVDVGATQEHYKIVANLGYIKIGL